MRILHIIYDDIENPWLGGGGATRTLEIYRRMVRMGHKVIVVCGNYPGARRIHKRMGVTFRHCGSARSYVWSRLTFMPGAARLIRRGGYDIVVEDVSPFSPVGAPLWCGGITSVASVQNLAGSHASSKYGLLGWGPRLIEGPLFSLFSNFVAVSPGVAGQLESRFGSKKIRVIPNGVGEQFLKTAETREAASIGGQYIFFLGRIDIYQKGLDRLIAAFDMLAGELADIDLIIAGDGTSSQMAALRSLISASRYGERVKLAGKVGPAEAAGLMRDATLLAMPSRYEAWPLTALEAGIAGTPVVGSDIVGVRDAAPPYPRAHGCLVPEGDIAALAQAMLKISGDAALRRQMGEKGRAWAGRFTWDALAQQQLGFYEEALGVVRDAR